MAIMPGAQWRPMPGSSTTRMAAYDVFCMHTMVGSLAGTDNYFRTSASGTNSHFGVGGDGTIYQWVDTAYRSGASLNGNYHLISAETADMGAEFAAWNTKDGNAVPAWTTAQVTALSAIAKWVHDTHGIPLTQIPDSKPGRRGVGYHRLGVPGYMVAGGEQWSTARGKVCPGDRRIAQVPAVIAGAQISQTPQEDDLDANQARMLQTIYDTLTPGVANVKFDGEVLARIKNVQDISKAILPGVPAAVWDSQDGGVRMGQMLHDGRDAAVSASQATQVAPAVTVDANAVATALAANGEFVAAITKAVLDGASQRMAS